MSGIAEAVPLRLLERFLQHDGLALEFKEKPSAPARDWRLDPSGQRLRAILAAGDGEGAASRERAPDGPAVFPNSES